MVIGLLFGVEAKTDVKTMHRHFSYTTMKEQTTYSPTTTYAPQRTLSYAIQYSPQLQLGSPYGQIGYGGQLTPTVEPQVVVVPNVLQSAEDTPQVQEAEMKQEGMKANGDIMGSLIALTVVGIVGYWLYKKMKKKKRK